MWARWVSTVAGLTPNTFAISLLLWPSAINPKPTKSAALMVDPPRVESHRRIQGAVDRRLRFTDRSYLRDARPDLRESRSPDPLLADRRREAPNPSVMRTVSPSPSRSWSPYTTGNSQTMME